MSKYNGSPVFSLSDEDFEELLVPFVFEIRGKKYALHSINSFSFADLDEINKTSGDDVLESLRAVAYDEETKEALPKFGIGVVKAIFRQWMQSQEIDLGESLGSEE